MKILHITVHLGGGAGKAIAGNALELGKDSLQKVILLEKPCDMYYYEKLSNEIPVFVEPDMDIIEECIKDSDVVVINWWGHPKMVKFLLEFPPIACRIVLWSHINGCSYPYLEGEFLLEFSHVFFTSKFSYTNKLWNRIQSEKIKKNASLIYGVGDFRPEYCSPKTDYSIKNTLNIGYVGTLSYAKLYKGFLEYYNAIIKEIPNVKFTMLGRVEDEVLLDIRNRGLDEYFDFPGFVTNTKEYYKKFDIFIYLLNNDSYATTENSLLEAMAFGIPIIVLDNPLERNIIYHELNGFLVNSIEEFILCINRLYSDKELREEIGKKARRHVIQNYDGKINSNKFVIECRDIILKKEKVFDFREILGEDPFEVFINISGDDGKVFYDYLLNQSFENKMRVKQVNKIFKVKGKGSLYQYRDVFPEIKEFDILVKCLEDND